MNARVVLRRLVLLGTPLVLGALEIWHPVGLGPNKVQGLLPHVDWWITLHLIQIPLFGLLAWAAVLLTNGHSGPAVLISRLALGVFAVFYVAFDAIVGVATGVVARRARDLPLDQHAGLEQAVQALFASEGNHWVADVGRFGWLIGLFAAVVVLYRTGRPLAPLALLAWATVIFWWSHEPPFGPLGMLGFFLAMAWLEYAPRRGDRAAHPPTAQHTPKVSLARPARQDTRHTQLPRADLR
jgi:hypothetical protein